jgi:hypothetical protein
VWEFKTKWSQENKAHLTKPLLKDLRQVLLYAYSLRLQTGLRVDRVHVRYATVDPTGRVTLTTHSYAFDPVRFKWAVADALRSATAYVDRTLATLNVDALATAVHRPNGWTMPDYQLLRLVGVRPLVDPRASAELPAPRGPWVTRLGALWIPPKDADQHRLRRRPRRQWAQEARPPGQGCRRRARQAARGPPVLRQAQGAPGQAVRPAVGPE